MNSVKSKTANLHRPLANLLNKTSSKSRDKYVALSNISIYYTWKIIKNSYKRKKFKIVALTWNDKFELLDGSYSVSGIRDYFGYIIKKQETVTDNPPVRIYLNKIGNKITFKIRTGYSLELLMKLLRSIKNKIAKDKNGENVPYLGNTEVVLVHSNIASNGYQHDSRVLDIFVPYK